MNARQALLTSILDYAGLYPPAGLRMPEAVFNYGSYLGSAHGWMLDRFVLPWASVADFEREARPLLDTPVRRWSISLTAEENAMPPQQLIEGFHQRIAGARIDSVEVRASSPAAIERLVARLHSPVKLFVEMPLPSDTNDPEPWIEALEHHHANAKIRTGGLTPETIPSSQAIARFLHVAAKARVPFKATAGLHHPVRSSHPLTYEAQSPSATMHGFLNVFVAATVAYTGGSQKEIEGVLEETSADAFVLTEESLSWNRLHLDTDQICVARSHFALSFGSCSFTEPTADLEALRWL